MSALIDAWTLLAADGGVRTIAARTVLVSGVATALAVVTGVPLGYAIARTRFRGRTLLLAFINTAMGFPPVVVGLVVWLLLVRSGPFGGLDLIYTRRAMVLAQILIATPIVIFRIVVSAMKFAAETRLMMSARCFVSSAPMCLSASGSVLPPSVRTPSASIWHASHPRLPSAETAITGTAVSS